MRAAPVTVPLDGVRGRRRACGMSRMWSSLRGSGGGGGGDACSHCRVVTADGPVGAGPTGGSMVGSDRLNVPAIDTFSR